MLLLQEIWTYEKTMPPKENRQSPEPNRERRRKKDKKEKTKTKKKENKNGTSGHIQIQTKRIEVHQERTKIPTQLPRRINRDIYRALYPSRLGTIESETYQLEKG